MEPVTLTLRSRLKVEDTADKVATEGSKEVMVKEEEAMDRDWVQTVTNRRPTKFIMRLGSADTISREDITGSDPCILLYNCIMLALSFVISSTP